MKSMDLLTQPSPKRQRIRLFFMGSTYALGTFNDNFFKQAASLLALSYGLKQLQGDATMLFALPFVLFSAWAGWLSDRLPKTAIVKWAKALELAAMCCGAYGLITLNWNFILIMVGTMGLQSTLFSPALNGSIPETFPSEDVPKVNAILKLATTVTILLGIASAGFALDQTWGQGLIPVDVNFGRIFVSAIAIFASLAGLGAALFLSRSKSANREAKFPWAGPLNSLKDCWQLRHDSGLALVLAGEAYFYFISALAVLLINDLGRTELGYSLSRTGMLAVALMLGICAGAMLAGRGTPLTWLKTIFPAGAAIGLGFISSGFAPFFLQYGQHFQFGWLIFVFTLTGFAGGIYLIPLTSFIQVRPNALEKGRVLGISGFVSFAGIILSGECYNQLAKYSDPSTGLILCGALTLLVSLVWLICKNLIQKSPKQIDPSLENNLNMLTLDHSIFK